MNITIPLHSDPQLRRRDHDMDELSRWTPGEIDVAQVVSVIDRDFG